MPVMYRKTFLHVEDTPSCTRRTRSSDCCRLSYQSDNGPVDVEHLTKVLGMDMKESRSDGATSTATPRSGSSKPQDVSTASINIVSLFDMLGPVKTEAVAETTTLMLRHIPNSVNDHELYLFLDAHGCEGSYDVVFIPQDKRSGCNRGYAFINFLSESSFRAASDKLRGKVFPGKCSNKVTAVAVANIQGREELLAADRERANRPANAGCGTNYWRS